MSSPAETPTLLTGRRAERARIMYLDAARKYLQATTPDQRIRREAECRRLAQRLDPQEIQALTEAASRAVARAS